MPVENSNVENTCGTTLIVNGEELIARVGTLHGLLKELGYDDNRVATAVNGEFVANDARKTMALKTGDHIEIVSARQGG